MLRIVSHLSKYLFLVFLGFLLVLLCSTIQEVPPPPTGEYYYSGFLRNNYTVLTASIFLIVGLLIGRYFKLNPSLSGISLMLIYPITTFFEATVYKGSHNLIPFELLVYLLWSIPAIAGNYIGRYVSHRIALSKSARKKANT